MTATTADSEFVASVQARQRSLLHAAVLMTGDRHAAEDLLQEALIKLAQRWDKVSRGAETAYVRRTMYHDFVSRWRKFGRERPSANLALVGAPANAHGGPAHDPIGEWEAGPRCGRRCWSCRQSNAP